MPVLIILKMKERARKFPSASHVPKGRPIARLMIVAMVETCNESAVTRQISGLKDMVSFDILADYFFRIHLYGNKISLARLSRGAL
jgi:hypothetical protein